MSALYTPRERTARILARFAGKNPRMSVERARYFTQYFRSHDHMPMTLRWAGAMCHVMANLEVDIQPDELIVGRVGPRGRYGLFYPELEGAYFATVEKNRMQIAAYYGGLAITASGTTAVHALSYPLGGKYHIAHGVSNAILLAPVMRFNESACRDKFAIIYDRCCHDEVKTCKSVEEKAAWVINRLEEIVKHLEIPTSLKEFGVPESDLDQLVEAGMQVQRLLVNNPRKVTPEDARALYQQIM